MPSNLSASLAVLLGILVTQPQAAEPKVLREESNDQFVVQVLESGLRITRKDDGKQVVLKGQRGMPVVMLGQSDSTLLVPMNDSSYWMIDLEQYVFHEALNYQSVFKIEGGGRQGESYGRTRSSWALEKNLGDGWIYGSVMDINKWGGAYFVNLNQGEVIAGDEATLKLVMVRTVSINEEDETPLRARVDPKWFDLFLEKCGAIAGQPAAPSDKDSAPGLKALIAQGYGDGAQKATGAMNAHLATWSPVGRTMADLKSVFGPASEETGKSITYMFDSGSYAAIFEFRLEAGRVVELHRPPSE